MKPGTSTDIEGKASSPTSWSPSYPNPADLAFDYDKLLRDSPVGLGRFSGEAPSVAVVGAGVAGLVAARELFRCGCAVTIYEASKRIGGRLYTKASPRGRDQTGMEMGAMRMPFFTEPGQDNSLLDYYLVEEPRRTVDAEAKLAPFPNPGQAAGNTGIYLNGGLGPRGVYPKPRLISYPKNGEIDDPDLQDIKQKVDRFISLFTVAVKATYGTSEWADEWARIVEVYDDLTFGDVVMKPAIREYKGDGDFGGLGMNDGQSDLLYTIGIGDGSWGAFYEIAALWFIRCNMFGFTTNLQTVVGLEGKKLFRGEKGKLTDARGKKIRRPRYQGIQALPEYLLFCPPPGLERSLYDAVRDDGLFLQAPVSEVVREDDGLTIRTKEDVVEARRYDHVIVTSPQWASQMSFRYTGFSSEAALPLSVVTARNTQHNISSCKLFFPLEKPYWLDGSSKLPQVMITDTFIQDVYALRWGASDDDRGAILASYTWEDDSLKLLPYKTRELAKLVLGELQRITQSTVGEDITKYIDQTEPVTIQWIKKRSYLGCAKLYRARNWDENFAVMSYNQEHSASSHLYLAGENYGLEGGWTEPALRTAIDAVLHVIVNAGGDLITPSFSFERDYPKWTRHVTVTTEFLPPAVKGEPYDFALTAAGGEPPYTWALLEGALPEGVEMTEDGRIAGTPATVAHDDYLLMVQVTDSSESPQKATQPLVISAP